MEKYIGFDIDDKKTVACVVQKGKKDRYDKRKKIAVVATVRKLLSVMRAMLMTGEVFNENLVLRQEQGLSRRKMREFYQ